MALIKCHECGSDVSTEAQACPKCGAPVKAPATETLAPKSELTRPMKPWEVIVALVGAAAVIWWLASPSSPKKTDGPVAAESSTATANTVTSANAVTAAQIQDDPPLGKKEAGLALSDYIGQAKAVTDASAMMSEVYFSKIKQDLAWHDLDKFREDAEAAKGSAQKAQESLSEIQRPVNLADDDAAQFDNVAMAFDDIAIARVSLFVDVAVYANTGMQEESETNKDIAEAKRAAKALKQKALAAYKHFGFVPSQIDADTLTIKKAQPS